MRTIITDIIGHFQSSFLRNRQAGDNAIIVQETITHFNRMKGKNADMIIKIDLEKAFDKLEWSFTKNILTYFNFPGKAKNLIMSCITTSKTAVLLNRDHTEFFRHTKDVKGTHSHSISLYYVWNDYLGKLKEK